MERKFRPAFSYHFLTPVYDLLVDSFGFGKKLKVKVISLANIKNSEKVLDVGAGTGTLIIEAKKKFPKLDITGLDPDGKILNIAEGKMNNANIKVNLVKGYSQKIPFKDSTFDLVISTLTFHHLKTDIKKLAAKEINRVLKKGGRFLLADFGKPTGPMSSVLLHIGSIFDGGEEMRANLRGELPIILQEAGFEVTKLNGRHLGVEFLLGEKI